MEAQLNSLFQAKYNKLPSAIYFAPGRVNLIGEHIDYNGGLVLPCAITAGTWLALAPNNDGVLRFASENFEEYIELPLAKSYSKSNNHWYNYPLGVVDALLAATNIELTGLDLLFFGNIPIGSGLSSSASIEVLTAHALNTHFELNLPNVDLVKLAKKVENEFIGVNSGIMDQFAIAFGATDKAIVLDCNTLNYQMVDANLKSYKLAIINTNKHRTLADSKYNERVEECNAALSALQTQLNIKYLCELNTAQLAAHSHLIADETVAKRAKHVVEENERVHLAAKALAEQDLLKFGQLMYASHQSLKELYEVTGKELNTVVEFCSNYANVIGARMTGAGFGGCAIALIEENFKADFEQQLTTYYQEKIGYPCHVYFHGIGNGPHKL